MLQLSAKEIKRMCMLPIEVNNDIITKFIPIAEQLYVKELLGRALYEDMIKGNHPTLNKECRTLLAVATMYSLSPFYLEEKYYTHLEQQLEYTITSIKQKLSSNPRKYHLYRPSTLI